MTLRDEAIFYARKSIAMGHEAFREGVRDERIPRETAQEIYTNFYLMCSYWAESGMQSIEMPHKFAAALMATSYVDTPPLPWPEFEIQIPFGILVSSKIGSAVSVLVSSDDDGCITTNVLFERGFCPLNLSKRFAEDVVFADDVGPAEIAEAERLHLLIRRLVVNTCLHVNERRSGSSTCTIKRDSRGRPVPRGFKLGRALDLDCRQHVRDYFSGVKRSSPTTVTLVRGHWRNQACGPRNELRRLMWIEPFYRGPDGAPMLIRPTKIGGDE